ncbi:MAG: DUF1778 domain-containing protein [Rhodospirillaceae bacterium]
MTRFDPGKIERIDIRTTASIKRTLQWAAEATNRSVTDFLLDSGVTKPPETSFAADLTERKAERIVLRISPVTKSRLKAVAEAAGKTMTECLIESGLQAAALIQRLYPEEFWREAVRVR